MKPLERVLPTWVTTEMAGLIQATMEFHTQCKNADIDDGRHYWMYERSGELVGLAGYHWRCWDPPDVCWGGWYCVHPSLAAQQKLAVLTDLVVRCAEEPQFARLYMEVYADPASSNVHALYSKLGFHQHGLVENFYGQKKSLAIMSLSLDHIRADMEPSGRSRKATHGEKTKP